MGCTPSKDEDGPPKTATSNAYGGSAQPAAEPIAHDFKVGQTVHCTKNANGDEPDHYGGDEYYVGIVCKKDPMDELSRPNVSESI